jgi:hypothetical protein
MPARLGVAALGLALLLAACGNSEEGETPDACLSGPLPIERALAAAPEPVRLDGGTAISECLVENQSAGELGQVGGSLIAVATELRASADGGAGAAEAATRLGYLVGAVRRGAAETGGIHADLVLRLASAAAVGSSDPPLDQDSERAYARGYAAGRRSG